MQTNTTDHKIWHSSPVKTSNGTIARPANYSSLAATWYRNTVCADCSYNSFVVYQDSDSRQFQLVNTSTSGDVKYTTLSGNPAPGSGTAFGLQWRSNVQGNIRLSYQIDGGQLASTAWNSTYSWPLTFFLKQQVRSTPPSKTLTFRGQVQRINGANGKRQSSPPITPGILWEHL